MTQDYAAAEAEVCLPEIGSRERYEALMQVVRNRVTVRRFRADYVVPEEHYALILEAARLRRPAPTPSPGISSPCAIRR
jgi:5,6-dimethylbenzimidazole synthase